MTEKEMHLWVAVKWYIVVDQLKKGEGVLKSLFKAEVYVRLQLKKYFFDDCAYCENNAVCSDCPLAKINHPCRKYESWYRQTVTHGNIKSAQRIYEFAAEQYRMCLAEEKSK